jgi:hypothetical protein
MISKAVLKQAQPRLLTLASQRAQQYVPVSLAMLLVVCWVALMASINRGQFSDSIEQLNWAHSLELGYWKHPPLSTWLMWAAERVFGPHPWDTYVLAAICYAATGWFTWSAARHVLSERAATLAILLWPLHHGLSWRAQVYNHNTVLLLTAAAMTWATLRAVRSGRRLHWALAGVLAGLALLTKYQAVVPILALVAGLAWTHAWRDKRAREGTLLAALCAAAVFLPHLLWAWNRAFPGLSYLQQSAGSRHPGSLPAHLGNFAGVQVGLHGTMLLALAILAVWPRVCATERPHDADRATQRRWLFALVGVPCLMLCLAVLVGGLEPQKFWGFQTLQFLPLALGAWLAGRRPALGWRVAATVAAGLSVAGAALATRDAMDASTWPSDSSQDVYWPAEDLASRVVADWRAHTACPMRYVVGAPLPAGLVSAYSGLNPVVVEDGDISKTPWVSKAAMQEAGYVLIEGPMPSSWRPFGASHMRIPTRGDQGPPWVVTWHVVPPASACGR